MVADGIFCMNLKSSPWRSLKFRITLYSLAIFIAGLWSFAFYTSRMLNDDMQRLFGEQQSLRISFIATEVDRELADRLAALDSVARMINRETMNDRRALQAFLYERLFLLGVFNAGVVAYGFDGTAAAENPIAAGRIGINYMDVDAVAAALKEGKASIGSPVMDRKLRAPVFAMAVPVRDAGGAVIGALAGVTNLSAVNFLDRITESRYGQGGYYLIEEPTNRITITDTGKKRIMQGHPEPGLNALLDRHVLGFDDTGIAVNPLGVEVLASARRIPVANWFIVGALPTAEAFAPIHAMQQRIFWATILLTLLAGLLTWWMVWRQLSPMLATTRNLAALSDSDRPAQPLAVTWHDEIGQANEGFNGLLAILGKRNAALRESEARFRDLFAKNSSVMLLVEPQSGQIRDANRAAVDFYGYTSGQLGTMLISEINTLPAPSLAEERQKALSEERNYFQFQHRLASGALRDVEVHTTPIESAGQTLLFSIVHDITTRQEAQSALQASETWFRRIFENANTGMATCDRHGQLSSFNECFRAMLGYDAATLLGMRLEEFTHPDDYGLERGFLEEVLAGQREHFKMTKRYITVDRRILWIDLFVTVIRDAQGDVAYFAGLVNDITERRLVDEQLRIAAVAFESKEAMVVTDANYVILKVNQAFIESTGYAAEEAVGQTPRLLQSGRHSEDFYREMWETIHRTGCWQGEVWDRRKNGEVYPKWLIISAVIGIDGTVTNFVGTHYDITERKKAEEKIEALAFFDQLTGLPNRTLLRDRLRQVMRTSARSNRYSALLFIDLDNFKVLNDTLGHEVGDALLMQVGQRLKACVREVDTVARLGGDEFVLILSSLSTSETEAASAAETVADKILLAFKQTYQIGNQVHHSTASIGVTLFRGTLISLDDLLKQADLTMYRAKAAGRNTVRFFDPAMELAVKERAALEDDLRLALVEQQFELHYQAQVAGECRVTGAEVLLRWHHPRRGMVSPAEFIPLAEESGLILALGHWVLETACRQLARWAGEPGLSHLTLAVNVSAQQFRQDGFVDEVLAVLSNTGANPLLLKLELTESLLVHDVEVIIEKMFALKAKGIGFALDDFGTGYSSLSYLKRLPLDQLKIDQSFVRDVLIDPNDAAIARTIVALAQSLGLGVIAEGVETLAQREFLASVGCHAFQGYLFSRPLRLEDYISLAKGPSALPEPCLQPG
jgi:diguanylate cyclase (GGDEF)-like protein/PAS domain S-box-containing protein